MIDAEPQAGRLSQRELRNESGRGLRAVSEGRSFVLTNSGVPAVRIVPLGEPAPTLRIVRPARRQDAGVTLTKLTRPESSSDPHRQAAELPNTSLPTHRMRSTSRTRALSGTPPRPRAA